MLVRYFMTTPVVSIPESMTCSAALQLFRERRFRRAPVLRDGALVGMLSEREAQSCMPSRIGALEARAALGGPETLVGAVMDAHPCTTTPDTHLEDVAQVMITNKISAMPVLSGTELAGIITESDLFRALVSLIGAENGVRLTVMPPHAGGASARNAQPELLCMRLGLKLTTMLHHESPGGESLTMLRACGPRWKELAGALVSAGFTLVELVPPKSDAA